MRSGKIFDMSIENIPQSPISEALAKIRFIRQNAEVMGAQDYEPSAFDVIEIGVSSGDISPDEGVQRAQAILDSKMDYH